MKNPHGATVLGRQLATLRKVQNLTQEELADKAGVGLATIKRIEQAAVSPSADVLISISRALKIHLYELVQNDAITESDQ